MNKGSTEPWHSFPAGLCKPGTKPPVSALTECCYYTLRATLTIGQNPQKLSYQYQHAKPFDPCIILSQALLDMEWINSDEQRGAKETLRTQRILSDFCMQISRKHKYF